MKKLTLEHIASHLPYKLKAINNKNKIRTVVLNITEQHEIDNCILASSLLNNKTVFKPILRPCDLTKPITIGGKEVIPIVELAKIAYDTEWFYKPGNVNAISAGCLHGFEYNKTHFEFYSQFNGGFLPVKNQLALFKWLYANKFDVDGLIDAGLAIDVNTLETNPYNT